MNLNDFTKDELRKIAENKTEEKTFRKALSRLLAGDSEAASKPLLIGVTPNAIECCINQKGLNLVITKTVISKCMKEEIRDDLGKQKKKSGHGLTEQQLNDMVWAIKRPVLILKGSHPDTLAVMTDLKDKEDRYIFAFIAVNQIGAIVNINQITSVYGRNNLEEYLNRCIENDMILAINKEKVNDMRLSIGGHFSKATTIINFDNTVAYSLKSVKQNDENS